MSGVVVAVEGPGRSGVGQDLPSGLCVASGMAGVPRRTDAVQGGGPWIAVLAGQAGGVPGPPQHRCARARPGPRAPQSSRAGRRGRGAGRGRWLEKPVQERDQGDDASLDEEGIPDPDEEVASVDDSGVAGPWLQHWVPPPGCRRPLGLVFTQLLRSGTGHHSHRDWDPPGLPTPTAGPISGDLHTGRAGGAGRLALDPVLVSSPRTRSRAGRNPDAAQQMEADLHSDGSRRRAAELAWTVRDSICI